MKSPETYSPPEEELNEPSREYLVACEVLNILTENGYEAYFIGGMVRDLLLGRDSADFDLATNATPDQILGLFAESKHPDTSVAYGVTRVSLEDFEFEIATFRKDIDTGQGRHKTKVEFANLEDDVERRDFTINALAFDPKNNTIIDYVGGVKDIEDEIIRFVGDPKSRIEEDPLRLLRAIRFKNRLGFQYDPDTEKAILSAVQEGFLGQISQDRLNTELTKMLIDPSREIAFFDLDRYGILDLVLPEISAEKQVAQPEQFHAEGDVFKHQTLLLDNLPQNPSKILVWSALLHDIGKPLTQTLPNPENSHDRIRFNGHAEVGSRLAVEILHRLRFSQKEIEAVEWIIANHINITQISNNSKRSTQFRLFSHPYFPELLALLEADSKASLRAGPNGLVPDMSKYQEINDLYSNFLKIPQEQKTNLKEAIGIDGKFLITHYGLKQGPLIGRLLHRLETMYLDDPDTEMEAKKNRLLSSVEGLIEKEK